MAAADVAPRPSERIGHKRPFASWLKRVTNLNKSHNSPKDPLSKKSKKASKNNNPYPQSGRADYRPSDSSHSNTDGYVTPPSRQHHEQDSSRGSYSSLPESRLEGDEDGEDTHGHGHGHDVDMYHRSRSNAPTVETQPGTIHSDAGYSRALTGTTAGGALSSIDGAGANSTFSSPNQSTRSLTTTLTTIQSSNALNPTNPNPTSNPQTNSSPTAHSTPPVHFSHQYPVAASAIPSHLQTASQQPHQPTTYFSATAHNLLTDNASILTLASSSKRRRRSMDTDASVRAMAPRSVWGDSRESLPLSVLSGGGGNNNSNYITSAPAEPTSAPRPNNLLRDERASVYTNQGVSAPALVSERNSFYASSHKAAANNNHSNNADGRSVRSVHLQGGGADGRSLLNFDGASLRGYEGSVRSGALGHGRNESVSGSPLGSPSLLRRPSGAMSLDVRDESVY
ncbi:hypothetical protein AAFC00_004476 [Neodothiora populina]|uniref:Ca2+-modulated nonselective cation channel polycystin n=1 Tax=Neodothiora populina TaxID=2781224 RepID=A0ABR3P3H8_9PEZI